MRISVSFFVIFVPIMKKVSEKFGGYTYIYLLCHRLADFERVRWTIWSAAETWIQLARWTNVTMVAGSPSP